MSDLNLRTLTEADIITKRVMPAILDAGWNDTTQIRQEIKLRDSKVIVRGKVALSGLHACSGNYYAGAGVYRRNFGEACQAEITARMPVSAHEYKRRVLIALQLWVRSFYPEPFTQDPKR